MATNKKTEVIVIDKEAKTILAKGQSLKITNEQTLKEATELLSQANIVLKSVKGRHDEEAEPFETELNKIEVKFKPTERALKDLIAGLRGDMSAYQTEAMRIQKEKEDKIAARIGEGKGKLQVETAVAQIDNLEKPAGSVTAESGSLSFRPDKKLKIVDESLIPRAYLVPNESLILLDLKAGREVAGCEIEIIQVPINRRG